MKTSHAIDEARLAIMLNELRLPTIKMLWPRFAEQADREGWPAGRFLSAIAGISPRNGRLQIGTLAGMKSE